MRASQEEISELTSLIFAAALDASRWPDFLRRLSQISGDIKVHLFGHDMQTNAAFDMANHGYSGHAQETFKAYYAGINEWMPRFARGREGEVLYSSQLCPTDALKKTEFYHDWVRPEEDITGGGGSVLFNEGDRRLLFGGNIRARDSERLEEDWMQLVALLTPYLQHAFEINRALGAKTIELLAKSRPGNHDAAILVVNAGRQIMYCNRQAQEMLEQGIAMRSDLRGRLCFTGRSAAALLSGALAALQTDSGEQANTFEVKDSGTGLPTHLCRTARIIPEQLGFSPFGMLIGGQEPCLLLTLSPLRARPAGTMFLQREGGLTGAEASVVAALADGLSPGEIADARAVSIHTVRNQLKSAMFKLGVRRQSDLVRVVLARPAPGPG